MIQPVSTIHGCFLSGVRCVALTLTAVFVSVSLAHSTPQRSDERLTVIGCIKRSEADVQRTPDVTATMSGGTQYVLVNITLSGDRATTNGTGTSLGALIAQSVNMYRLDDSAVSEIAPHVGERVEVTGALVNEPEAPTGTSGRRDQWNAIAKSPLLKIQSFRTISADSASCAR